MRKKKIRKEEGIAKLKMDKQRKKNIKNLKLGRCNTTIRSTYHKLPNASL
jgi:hypothetical protein